MTGTLFYYPRLRAFNAAGLPVPGARLYVYRAGTSDLAATYTTAIVGALGTPHQNPQIADASGEFRALYLDSNAGHDYTFVCQTPEGVQLWAEPDVPPAPGTVGSQGDPGEPGEPGLSVAEIAIYLRAATLPDTPTGGSFDFGTQTLDPPAGWSVTIPSDTSEPIWVSIAVAAADSITGTDDTLTWTTPTVLAQDGASVNIIFKREATQPSTPAPSAGIPATWYDDVAAVPASSDLLWSSVGTRDNASRSWIWQLPIQVEGGPGPQGADATLYYIRPVSGTAIKNGTGTLRVEARYVFGGNEIAVTTGSVKLYVGSTLVTVANGYASGSDGYIGVFDSTDITGAATVSLKDGPAGNVFDTITLVDIIDGTTSGPGVDGVYGYVEADGPLIWTRASDGTTWTPAGTTLDFDCTFVQGGADVARVAWRLTRDTNGLITGASTTHTGGDLNSGRVTVTELGEGTASMTVKFSYSNAGDICVVAEGANTSMAGVGGAGPTGPAGTSGLVLSLSRRTIPIWAYQNGTAVTGAFADASGQCTVYEGSTNRTATATYVGTAVGCTGTVNAAGAYSITAMSASQTATFSIAATYGAITVTEVVTITKIYAGYEIVTSLPTVGNFLGRIVFLSATGTNASNPAYNKLYRYGPNGWTAAVDGGDIQAASVTTDAMFAGTITTAKLRVTQLSVLSTDAGTITAGVVQSPSGGARFDLNNARIIYNSAPGYTGGYVRVTGANFGPSANYLDWYGPKPAGQSTDSGIVGALTDTDALWYVKTNGESKAVAARIRGEFEPKAWGRFSYSGGVIIQDRYNVATIVRTSQGRFTITFEQALANTNYAAVVTGSNTGAGVNTPTTSGFNVTSSTAGGDWIDPSYYAFIVFGSNVVAGSNYTTPEGGKGGGTTGLGYKPTPIP